ncbi:C3 and PZP-like alpha-2-macroglobulin domain-containing protein 8 [Holothuria leucospilota]|uniref:C3 and PZP-like alpha-2-macroglobulin domain-containing protein 8 n=1 Tax=Holothuria leucospilota TaxID=206669 RepID=A0A9Q1CQE1_HOLLE|nr:C3 and PZP-like alpha-2-macroglobulin domain-containing protein 8 [Holothuria leucospilota]
MKIFISIFYLTLVPGLCFGVNADDATCSFPLQVNTTSVFSYRFLEIPHGITQIRFDVKAKNDVHIGLFPNKSISAEYYLIVIGSNRNKVSDIRRCRGRPCVDKKEYLEEGIVSQDEFRQFCITFECNGNITVGRNEDAIPFLQWTDPNPLVVNYMGYSTGWGSTGEFRFCNFAKKHEIVRENDVLYLTCEANFVLYSIDAVYGYDRPSCATVSTGTEGEQSCFSEDSEQVVSTACNYRRYCTVEASDEVFNSLCTKAQQYMRVSYVCTRRDTLPSPSSPVPSVIVTSEAATSGQTTLYMRSNEEENPGLLHVALPVPVWLILAVCSIAVLLTLSGTSFLVWKMIRRWKSKRHHALETTLSARMTSFQGDLYMSLQTDGMQRYQKEKDLPALTHTYHTMPDVAPQVELKAENEEVYADYIEIP